MPISPEDPASQDPASQDSASQKDAEPPSNSPADSALLTRIAAGDEQAMSLLFDLHGSYVYSIALRILESTESAEDVLHQVFMQLWRAPGDFTELNSNLRGSLALLARNQAIDLLRKRRPHQCLGHLPIAAPRPALPLREPAAAFSRHPAGLATLLPRDRTALDMAFFAGCTDQEIAHAIGITSKTARSSISAGLRALRE